jgi:hypothetical protein
MSITIPGGSPQALTTFTEESTWVINQQYSRQGDTATFYLYDVRGNVATPGFYVPALSQISFTDTALSKVLFSGLVTTPTWTPVGPTTSMWQLDCTDWTYISDRTIVAGDFIGYSTDQIVNALITQANCGLTAGTILPGPTIARVQINYLTLTAAIQKLTQLSSQGTDYGWNVNYSRQINFGPWTSLPSPVYTLTDQPIAVPSSPWATGTYGISNFKYQWMGSDVRSSSIVRGSTYPGTGTDTFRGDGVTTQYVLKYKLNTATTNPVLIVNGAAKTLDSTAGTYQGTQAKYSWAGSTILLLQSIAGPWALVFTAAPASGSVISITYGYTAPIIARADNTAFEATYAGLPNGGVFQMYTADSTLTTLTAAQQLAQADVHQYGVIQENVTLDTSEGWNGSIFAGDLFTFKNQFIPDSKNSWAAGISATMLALSMVTSGSMVGYRTSNIQGVRVV